MLRLRRACTGERQVQYGLERAVGPLAPAGGPRYSLIGKPCQTAPGRAISDSFYGLGLVWL